MSSTRSFSTSEDARVLSILRVKDDEEARIGRIAQRKATSAAARQYGDMLVNDHIAHRKEVTDAAWQAGLVLWDDESVKRELQRSTGAPREDAATTLERLDSSSFDREFGRMMAQAHADTIRTLEEARSRLTRGEVRSLVERTLPVLKRHQETAQGIADGRTSATDAHSGH